MKHLGIEPHVIGIDIGGTKIAAAIVTDAGQIIERSGQPTPVQGGAAAVLAAAIDTARDLLASAAIRRLPVAAVGIGSGGQVDVSRGLITYASDTLPGWQGLPLAREVREALGLPVFVDNDVNALALGEQHFGAGRGFDDVLHVAVGTGLGGALVRAGELWRGVHWSAGEICHLVVDFDGKRRCSCGALGHLEAYTSGPAIAARYAELAGLDESIDLRQVAARAQRGDATARTAIAEGARILGTALGGVMNLLDAEAIVVGGGVPEIGDLWWQPFEEALRANPLPGPATVALRRAELGVDAALVGAAWLAMESVRVQTEK